MEDESNDFLGEVIDFGDGKTYTVPLEEEEAAAAAAASKETRLGDDYDRSWPRTRSQASDPEGAHAGQPAPQHAKVPWSHGPPPRHPPGDGRVLFNERSNRLEPARLPASAHILAPGGPSHHHGPPYAHIPPPRTTARRNSALSGSEHPKMGSARDPPPHAVPVMSPENRGRRSSDARSAHSPVERRSSFLHDEERPRMGSMGPKSRVGDEPGSALHGVRRETSRDSQLGSGERQPWGAALQRTTSHRTVTDPLHVPEPAGIFAPVSLKAASVSSDNAAGKSLLSPSGQITALPTIPSSQASLAATTSRSPEAPGLPIVPAALNEERENFMKQAAERARRRKLEEETAREEARERARKKAAELEVLSKASLVSASPLVALTRQSSMTGLSSRAKSPAPKSPSIAPSILPPSSVVSEAPFKKPQEAPEPVSLSATVTSWRAKAKPEPAASDAPTSQTAAPPVAQHDSTQQPLPTMTGGGMKPIEELDQVEGPLEILDFSDMSRLAGRPTSITSVSDLTRTNRPGGGDFIDETPSSKWPSQTQHGFAHWNRDARLVFGVLICTCPLTTLL
jgi:serine/arginine repetitive matrix protein 2